eukprot:CAMPEP_0178406188 /NCGR_PEP_ID=MMETSP0689_2-20121128/18785_1 /TAXON_ID=160604 /ORGANISM="Amphidinium massartii, Strain CS-259" /LENGTH=408 /DNA_ID=CAMNT_0020027225 /DNA_START=43 /DNA_END=1269 /DNA_ORIENTATION=+
MPRRKLTSGGPGRAMGQLARTPAGTFSGVSAGLGGTASSVDVEQEFGGRFLPDYNKKRLLGRGACGAVWLASANDGSLVALKQVAKGTGQKKRSDERSANTEIAVGSLLFQPGGVPAISPSKYPGIRRITKFLDAMETKTDLWLVMEYGGDVLSKALFEIKGEFVARGAAQPRERVYRVHHLPFYEAMKRDPRLLKRLICQILEAIQVLADHWIVHSDLKPDNLLIDRSRVDCESKFNLRLCDFGSAFMFDQPGQLSLATPEYMPPEALKGCISHSQGLSGSMGRPREQPWSFDMWSLGAIMLELCYGVPHWLSYKCRVRNHDCTKDHTLVGIFAVAGRDHERILQRQQEVISDAGFWNSLPDAPGVPIDEAGIDLLQSMLQWNPEARISPAEALEHPYLREHANAWI